MFLKLKYTDLTKSTYIRSWTFYIYIYIYVYIRRLASNEIFLPSNKIHREVGRAKDLSAPLYIIVGYPHKNVRMKVNLKQSRNRAGAAQRIPVGLGSQIFMTFGTWRWWGRQPHAPAAFTLRKMFLVLIFTRGWVDSRAMVRSEGNVTEKSKDTTGNRSWDRPTSSAAP